MIFAGTMLTLAPIAILAMSAAAAVDGGEVLGTMPHGPYVCALPGDAAGAAWLPDEATSFTIANASSYHTEDGRGVYLMRGKMLTFTRGPLKGRQLLRTGPNALRQVQEDGSLGDLRCVRTGSEH